jgi:hypothetical protein
MMTEKKQGRFHDRKEFFIVFAVMMGVMLPVRFLLVEYVSDNWWGSFGAISAIAVLMVVLVKKKKLGRFGEMFERQMLKLHQKGLRRKFVFGNMIFAIIVTGLLIYSINAGDTIYLDIKNEIVEQAGGAEALQENLGDIDKMYDAVTPEQILLALIAIPVLLFTQFPYFASLWAIENDLTNGFLLHLATVAFVETLEFFGILMFYRFALRRGKKIE